MRASISSVVVLTITTALLWATRLHAEPVPDAGSLLRQQEPQRRELPERLPESLLENDKAPQADSDVKVLVKGFVFSGFDGIVPEEELQALVAGSIGKTLGLRDLQALVERVSLYLKSEGWILSKAYLPRQDVTPGTIEIRIVTSRSDGGISINLDRSFRIRKCILQSMANRSVHPNAPINEQKLERSLLLMNDLPGVTARADIAAGRNKGASRIGIDVIEGPLFSGNLWVDNQGNRYTGAMRGNGLFYVNDPFGYADQLTILVTHADRLTQGRIGYNFPICHDGIRGTLAYTGMSYRLGEELASNGFEGSSNYVDAGLSYPLSRSLASNVTLTAGYSYIELKDSANGTPNNDKQVSGVTLAASGDRYDSILGGGYTNWSIGLTSGNFHGSGEVSATSAAANGTEGEFTRYNIGLARLQRISGPLSASLSWTAQLTQQNLDSSEKFSLGGPYGIRAYPVGEAMGDHGHLLNASLRYAMPVPVAWGAFQLEGFYDAGRITLQNTPTADPGTATGRNTYWLQGAGLGLNYGFAGRVSIKASWAHAIGENQGRSAAGNNSDGLADTDRYWLQALFRF